MLYLLKHEINKKKLKTDVYVKSTYYTLGKFQTYSLKYVKR